MLLIEGYRTTQSRRRFVSVLCCDQSNGFDNFDNEVEGDLVWICARVRDRENLTRLLSMRYPRLGWDGRIERAVVNSEFPQGLLVLCDAFDASSNARIKKALASGLRTALSPLGVDKHGDEEMVEASRDWFISQGDKYKPNPWYEPENATVDSSGRSHYAGLFIPREPPTPRRAVRK